MKLLSLSRYELPPEKFLPGFNFRDDAERYELIKLIAEQMPQEPLAREIADKCREELMP